MLAVSSEAAHLRFLAQQLAVKRPHEVRAGLNADDHWDKRPRGSPIRWLGTQNTTLLPALVEPPSVQVSDRGSLDLTPDKSGNACSIRPTCSA